MKEREREKITSQKQMFKTDASVHMNVETKREQFGNTSIRKGEKVTRGEEGREELFEIKSNKDNVQDKR